MQHILRAGLVVAALSCNPADPLPPGDAPMKLDALDASCTETWLRIVLPGILRPRSVTLSRDTQVVFSGTLLSQDTTILDEGPSGLGLLPNKSYAYTLTRPTGFYTDQARVTATTMDTTSHDFTWRIDTLGVGGGSILHDVAIINDTLAYAVGEIYKRDSLGNWDPLPYNAVKWNGDRWELLRVPVYIQGSTWYLPLRCITAFGPDDIWFEAGIHWDGTRYNTVPYTINYPSRINKSWGTSSQDFYVVGDGGLIAHYNGTTWRRLESGTTLPIKDILGVRDNQTGVYKILCVAEAFGIPGGSKILSIENGVVRELPTDGLYSWGVEGIWFVPRRYFVVIGQGVWKSHSLESGWLFDTTLPGIATRGVHGQNFNDIVVSGDFGLLAHYNGVSWQTYLPRTQGSLGGVKIKDNLIIACGWAESKAMVVQGRR